MSIRIFNSLSDSKQDIHPITENKVGMYVCGVTVYDMCHIGHARAYVTADVIYRYLSQAGYQVTYVRNFTDVDDKIIKRANELGIDCRSLSDRYIKEFYTDMDALGNLRPDVEPRVTDHIPEVIELVQRLLARGHAYQVDGDVYFHVPSYKKYGRLSKRDLDKMEAGHRVEVDQRKKNPMDFALWKSSKPGEPAWDSPWGSGRPGWHIECSAMSTKYLGETFDIHGGGKDLVFPHHENEIAQSEAASGKTFANVFFHNGFVNIDKEKMSKSLNNFYTIREISERYDPEALRYFLLTTHYRSPINFDVEFCCPGCQTAITNQDMENHVCPHCQAQLDENQTRRAIRFPALEDSQKRLEYLYKTKLRVNEHMFRGMTGLGEMVRSDEVTAIKDRFEEAMDDDFNAAAALGVLADAMRLCNEILDNKDKEPEALLTSTMHRLRTDLAYMGSVLGIIEKDPQCALDSIQGRALCQKGLESDQINCLVAERDQARANKNWKRADQLRDQLHQMGVELMDSPQGTTWKMRG